MFDRSWTVLLNPTTQLVTVDLPLPDGNVNYELEAWRGANAASVSHYIFDGALSAAQVAGRLQAGAIDALMVVAASPAKVRVSPNQIFTVATDGAPTGIVSITLRLRQVA